jgi:hypothetical protein
MLNNLGVVARDQSQFDEAAQYYAQALAICEEIGAVDVANTVRTNIAYLAEQQHAGPTEQREEEPHERPKEQRREPSKRRRRWPFGRRPHRVE